MQYGRIAHIELKIPPRPPGYAFVEVSFFSHFLEAVRSDLVRTFIQILAIYNRCAVLTTVDVFLLCSQFEDSRDAQDAIDGRDGYDFDGHRLRVGELYSTSSVQWKAIQENSLKSVL